MFGNDQLGQFIEMFFEQLFEAKEDLTAFAHRGVAPLRKNCLSGGHGGAYLDGGSISNCVVTGCSDPGGWGAGINAQNGTVSECVVEYADGFLGAIYSNGGLVERCELRNNTMTGHGGGIYAQQGAVIRSSLVYSNQSNYGGALTLFDSAADACTVENNTNNARVSGILLRDSTAANCISWSDDSGLYEGYTGSFVHCALSDPPEPAAAQLARFALRRPGSERAVDGRRPRPRGGEQDR